MTRKEKLEELYGKVMKLNDELPKELMEKLFLYGQILEYTGRLQADATKDWKLAEAKRRETIASAIVYGAEAVGMEIKTAKDREAAAEVIGAKARQEEALTEAEAQRWKNAYISTQEMIQILKKKYDHLKEVSRGGI